MINCDVLMLVDNPLTNDRRIFREMETLSQSGLNVVVLAIEDNSLPVNTVLYGCQVYRIIPFQVFEPFSGSVFSSLSEKILKEFEFKLIHAHDHTMLHLGSIIKKRKKDLVLIYDSHELFHSWPLNLSNFDSQWIFIKSFIVRKLYVLREKRNRKEIDFLITVNKSLATLLKKYLKIKTEPIVLRNTPNLINQVESSQILREKFNITIDIPILVFIGANIYSNTLNIEQVINEVKNNPKIAFVIICAFNKNSEEIRNFVMKEKISNIYFHDLVEPEEIPKYLSSADIGLVPTWNKTDLSYWYALDNKLFEYVQARIPILATAQPEYKNIVEDYNCGMCILPSAENAYFNGFLEILKNKEEYLVGVNKAASELNWEIESQKLTSLYKTIFNK